MNLENSFIKILKPKPSPLKKELEDLGISIAVAARYAGRSYPYIVNQLNGTSPLQPKTEQKLRQLLEIVRSESSPPQKGGVIEDCTLL